MDDKRQEQETFPLSVETWTKLMCDEKLFKDEDLAIILRIKELGGEASFSQLADEFGGSASSYQGRCERLAKRVIKRMTRQAPDDDGEVLQVLFSNLEESRKRSLSTTLKCREEISRAIESIKVSINLYEYDLPTIWRVNLEHQLEYISRNEQLELLNNHLLPLKCTRRNRNNSDSFQVYAHVHDLLILHRNGKTESLVELVTSETPWNAKEGEWYLYEYRIIRKAYDIETSEEAYSLLNKPETYNWILDYQLRPLLRHVMRPCFGFDYKTLSKECKQGQKGKVSTRRNFSEYKRSDFLNEVYMEEYKFDDLIDTLRERKNIILQGAPGVGKTHAAKRLAYAMMNEKDDERIKFVQFHQSYTYEDFIEGYRPEGDKFTLKEGAFAEFCWEASIDPERNYFFIIDEINRGNISRIFGELLMLIEKDYRNTPASLLYSGKSFVVPDNLYIIGMMNTADRSLSMIDYALRRRFAFFDMKPAFDTESFKKYQNSLKSDALNALIARVIELNTEIANDVSLGEGFCIGHSYFCNKKPEEVTQQWLRRIVNHDILPTLREYWFEGDDKKKLADWEKKLSRCCQ